MENSNYKNINTEDIYLNTWYNWLIVEIPEPIKKL